MRHNIKDPYKILGIERDANEEAIQKAFREKAKVLHPDTTTDDKEKKEKEEQFKELNEAYSILSDPNKKAVNDNHSGGFNESVLNSMYEKMAGMAGDWVHFGMGGMGNPDVSFHQTIQRSFDVNIFTLMLGADIEVVVSKGKKYNINIPSNTPANAHFQLELDKNITLILIPRIHIPKLDEKQLKELKVVISSWEEAVPKEK